MAPQRSEERAKSVELHLCLFKVTQGLFIGAGGEAWDDRAGLPYGGKKRLKKIRDVLIYVLKVWTDA